MKLLRNVKNITKSVLVVGLVFLSSNSWASWTGYQTIHRLYPSTHHAYVRFDSAGGHINPSSCRSAYYLILDNTLPRFKEQYQTLLTALAANKRVNVYVNGCIGSYARIIYIQIYRN